MRETNRKQRREKEKGSKRVRLKYNKTVSVYCMGVCVCDCEKAFERDKRRARETKRESQ